VTRIKICGLTRPEDIEAVNAHLPDYAGFVFAQSRRRITVEQARSLSAALDDRIVPVGVFVDAPISQIAAMANDGIIRMVQLHGSEDAAFIHELRQHLTDPRTPIIKAYRAVEGADYLLVDNQTPGSGRPLAMSEAKLRDLLATAPLPVFLAGGISPDTIETALSYKPYAIDISSGAETDGVKDASKIAVLVGRAHEEGRP
jgi:phosphoribosylanthranilate isomerase